MKEIIKGHKYEVDSFEGGEPQVIQFIHKENSSYDGELVTIQDGTTNEELIKVLINRIAFLNSKVPCRENSLAITKLEEALMWLDKRTENRKAQNIEGTPKP